MSLLSISNIINLSTLLLFIMIFHLALHAGHVLILMFNYLVKLESAKVWQKLLDLSCSVLILIKMQVVY